MQEVSAAVTSKGQVTIPRQIRKLLHLETGDRLRFTVAADGSVAIQPTRFPTVASLVGAAGTLDQPLGWNEMRAIAREDRLAEKTRGQQ